MQTKTSQAKQSRRRLNVLSNDFFPAYVVWELTLACDHACAHCGSRAAIAREKELSTQEALSLVDDLAKMGTREVVLIGGEAYLHDGFYQIISHLKAKGINPVMTTGAWGIDHELARRMAEAGMTRVSVSIDGLQAQHDRMRAKKGSFKQCLNALKAIKAAGMTPQVNSNFNRFNQADLEGMYILFESLGVKAWQVQITAPLGRAADRPQMLFQPYDLLDFLPRLNRLKLRGFDNGLLIMPGNNLGYFGPEEKLLRSPRKELNDHWAGCQAGRFVMGIESDGAVKGCPSLQTQAYVGGHYQAHSDKQSNLQTIWNQSAELQFTRKRTRDDLWGYCASCPLADTCLGGCSFTAHGFFGRAGNNPMCHFRAIQFQKKGLRERLIRIDKPIGQPFDSALFEITIEALDAVEPAEPAKYVKRDLVSIRG